MLLKEGKQATVPWEQVSGEGHADVYWKLVNESEKRGYDLRFTGDGTVV